MKTTQTFVLLRLHASQGNLFLVFGALFGVIVPSVIVKLVVLMVEFVSYRYGPMY